MLDRQPTAELCPACGAQLKSFAAFLQTPVAERDLTRLGSQARGATPVAGARKPAAGCVRLGSPDCGDRLRARVDPSGRLRIAKRGRRDGKLRCRNSRLASDERSIIFAPNVRPITLPACGPLRSGPRMRLVPRCKAHSTPHPIAGKEHLS